MKQTLIIFSGLPGTGKSTLATLCREKLQIPLFAIDDVVSFIPGHMARHAHPYWDDMISILLNIVASQLEFGLSVIVDSVFMGADRMQAYKMACHYGVEFRPIYTYVSDETVWKERVQRRWESAPDAIKEEVATWDRIQIQRKDFVAWKPNSALFIDSMKAPEDNFKKIIDFVTAEHTHLVPLS